MDQNDKKLCLSHPYLRRHTSYDRDFWYACKVMTYPDAFFMFSKCSVCGVLWQKILSPAVSGNVPRIIVVFGTHV